MRRAGAALALLLLAGCGGSSAAPKAAEPARDAIVVASSRDGDFEIYTIAPDGTDVRQLTKNQETDESEMRDDGPKWSRDGRWIAFASSRDHPLGGVERDEVYVMDAVGSNERRLTRNEVADTVSGWTAEGEIVFWRCEDGIAGCELRIIGRDGADERVVYETGHAVFESRGPNEDDDVRALLVPRESETLVGDVVAIDIETGAGRPVEDGTPSPDGEGLLIETDRDKNGPCLFHDCIGHAYELYVGARRLTKTKADEGYAVWSPDSTRILFGRIRDEQDDWELWMMNVDGTCERRLTDNGKWDWMPDWVGPRTGGGPLSC